MTAQAYNVDHYRTLLRAADRVPPAELAVLREWERQITQWVGTLRENTGCNWVVELEQDATFFATVTDVDKHIQSNTERQFPFSVRFSLWERLAALVYRNEPSEDAVALLSATMEEFPFILVPQSVLMEPYDGVDPMFLDVGQGRWYDRFFQYY